MKLYNTLTRNYEEFVSIKDDMVGIYTCGPTVYSYVTIGNWRTYTLADLIIRTLKYFGYDVDYVMNITDVGHLTGDNLGDASVGDDRLEKAALKEGKTAWSIAAHYTNDFLYWYEKLNLVKPRVWCKATDHIDEQIELLKKIDESGFAYKIDDGIYFDVLKYESNGNKYGELSTLQQIKEGARVEFNIMKRDPRDFALWKFSKPEDKRQMEWDSPWGRGFPGWHIECSAMSMKYLGDQFDIHVGGEDLRSTHHPNEIAQSECVTNKKPFVKYWIHGAFLLVDNGRMGKSLGNAYTVKDVIDRGYDPMVLRYFYLTGHYRNQLNFTWESLESASKALEKIYQYAEVFGDREVVFDEQLLNSDIKIFVSEFESAINEDLNMPKAIGVIHESLAKIKSETDLMYFLNKVDIVLGLRIIENGKKRFADFKQQNNKFKDLLLIRDSFRKSKQWNQADKIRIEIESQGYVILDEENGSIVRKKEVN